MASGPAAEVFSRVDLGPALGRYEAGAIIEGTVAFGEDRYGLSQVIVGGASIELAAGDIQEGSMVRMRVRARDVSIALEPPSGLSIRNCIKTTISEINREGDTYAELVLALGEQSLRARITAKSLDELGLKEGKSVYALLKAVSVERRAMASNEPPR